MSEISEKLVRLSDVPRLDWLPLKRAGRRLHLSTVYRWCQRGLRGVKLEMVQCGGTRCTTETALLRFFAALGPTERVNDQKILMSRSRESRNVLDRAGVGLASKSERSRHAN
jgi:hypothetical protein